MEFGEIYLHCSWSKIDFFSPVLWIVSVSEWHLYLHGCRAKLKLPYLCWLFVFTFSSCPLLELVCAQNLLLIEVTELLEWWNYKEKQAPQCLFIISVIVWCFHCVKWSSVCFHLKCSRAMWVIFCFFENYFLHCIFMYQSRFLDCTFVMRKD